MQQIFLSLLMLSMLLSAKAQYEEKDFVHYTVKEGLSENYITCLQQDDRGYMWIGTDIGLNRFDGHSFKHFFKDTKTLPLLSGNIKKLKLLGPHQLGIISNGGLQVLNTKGMALKNYFIADSTAFSIYRNKAWDAVVLPGKSYGVSTASGFYVFDASGKLSFSYDAFSLKDIGQKRILYGREIYQLNDTEYLVFVNSNGLGYYNATTKSFKEISAHQTNWSIFYKAAVSNITGSIRRFQLSSHEFIFMDFGNNNILYYNSTLHKTVVSALQLPITEFSWESRMTTLNDSTFFINGMYTGFYRFTINRGTGKITVDEKKMLGSHKIQCLFIDKEKRLWAGTSKGLLKQKLSAHVLKSVAYQPAVSDSVTGSLNCAYRYRNKLYIGRSSFNKGFIIADTSGKILKQLEFYGRRTQWNEISSIQMYHADTLWIGTTAGILWFDVLSERYGKLSDKKENANQLAAINILAPAAKDGYAWMCALLNGLLARYHIASRTFTYFTAKTHPAIPFSKVKSIAYDALGDVWISGHSLARWNSKKQIFDTVISVYGGLNKYEDDILTMVADTKGSLWLHNAFNGLLEYRIKEKRFVNYTKQDGLPSDVFYGFSPVINDQLWIAGNNQLTGFNTVTKKTVVYDYEQGLPDDKPSGRYLYFDSAGHKLYLFNEQIVTTMQLPQTPVIDYGNSLLIEELVINNKQHVFFPADGLKFSAAKNNLSLYFGIINFESGNNYQFAYKLNETQNWIDVGNQRNINLTGLSPGNYTISLRSMGKSGVQKFIKISFVIEPPFWKTTGFLLAILLLTGLSVYYFFRSRIKQVREKASIDKQLSEAEMKALHAQMNPHFIFNSLNSIREMILNNENNEASRYLSKFARLIRITLDQSGHALVSLRNTIEYLQLYIEMEKIRNNNFTCTIETGPEPDLDETRLPPMLIQPFIENAIWHGIGTRHKNIHIRVNFKKQNNQLVCTIEDDGIGINSSLQNKKTTAWQTEQVSKHNSVGINNIKTRIYLLNEKYKLQSSLSIEDKYELTQKKETGTLVTLHLPIET
jgi:ligand-binding sensor domain-containing protein